VVAALIERSRKVRRGRHGVCVGLIWPMQNARYAGLDLAGNADAIKMESRIEATAEVTREPGEIFGLDMPNKDDCMN